MLVAAEQLMRERGDVQAFTLVDVARTGQISIGSIYNRFPSKDALVGAVQGRMLERIDASMHAGLASAEAGAHDFVGLVAALIDTLAETLRTHAEDLRPLMQHAHVDPLVAATGKRSFAATANHFAAALLRRRAAIRHPDPERAVAAVFRTSYAALARWLGFGTSPTAARDGDWVELKQDLAAMAAAWLTQPPDQGTPR